MKAASNPKAEAKAQPCPHCGQPSEDGAFCCPGCEAAYALVREMGLDSYYRSRTLDGTARPPVPVEPAAFDYDHYTILSDGQATLRLMADGLHCAACVWLIETVLAREPGVGEARLNMTTRRMTLRWDPSITNAPHLIGVVARLGYRLVPYDPALFAALDRKEEKFLLLCLAVAGFASANVMLLSVSLWAGAGEMGEATRRLMEWFSALIVLPAAAFAGRPFFRSAASALCSRRLNMDVPISLAILLTLSLSLYETAAGSGQTYFESAAMLLFFLLIGRYLDRRARAKARGAAESLLLLQAQAATVRLPSGTVRTVPASSLKAGDILIAARGERLCADGLVIEGAGAVDESIVTGESLPRPVGPGDKVTAGTLALDSVLTVQVTAAGEYSTLARISRLVERATQAKNAYTRLADRVARLYAPVVHVLGACTFLGWWLAGAGLHTAILHAVAVLIVTCPCALALAVPSVQIAAAGRLLRRGIYLKSADALEKLQDIDVVVFDKTGTLTTGEFTYAGPAAPDDLRDAARLAAASRHPLARALLRAAGPTEPAPNTEETPGQGLRAGDRRLGSAAFCGVALPEPAPDEAFSEIWYAREGHAPVRFLFHDTLRSEAAGVVRVFTRAGIETRLMSGDAEGPVRRAARECGIEHSGARMSPEDKHAAIFALGEAGRKVLMIGDGINDAPALAAARISISFGGASDIAQLASDIVVRTGDLAGAVEAWRTARRASNAVHINFALSLAYNAIAVPLAMAGYVTPLFAALFMSVSSLTVMLNALRLNR